MVSSTRYWLRKRDRHESTARPPASCQTIIQRTIDEPTTDTVVVKRSFVGARSVRMGYWKVVGLEHNGSWNWKLVHQSVIDRGWVWQSQLLYHGHKSITTTSTSWRNRFLIAVIIHLGADELKIFTLWMKLQLISILQYEVIDEWSWNSFTTFTIRLIHTFVVHL